MKRRIRIVSTLLLVLSLSACRDKQVEGEEHGDEAEHTDSLRVALSEAAYTTAGIEVETAMAESVGQTPAGLEVPGEVNFDARRVAIISPRIGGRLERVFVVSGDRVAAGQPVATLYTPAFITAQAEYLQARRRASLLANTPDAQGASALVEAAANRLRQLGADQVTVRRIAGTGQVQEQLPITAPFSGSLIESSAIPGSMVEAGNPLFKIADLSFVDVFAAVPEKSVPLVRIGAKATVRIAAYPNIEFAGDVERIQQQLDEATRTIAAVIHVRNVGQTLKPGMFATVRLALPVSAVAATGTTLTITIPETAVLSEGDRRFVFVEVAPRTFEKREVEVASLEAPGASQPLTNRVIVRSGIRPGERVVVRGAFTLKSELGKAALGEHGH